MQKLKRVQKHEHNDDATINASQSEMLDQNSRASMNAKRKTLDQGDHRPSIYDKVSSKKGSDHHKKRDMKGQEKSFKSRSSAGDPN